MAVLTAEREAWLRDRVFMPAGTDGNWADRDVRDLFETLDEARLRYRLYEKANADNARVKWVLQHIEAVSAFFLTVRSMRERAYKHELGSHERTTLLREAGEMAAKLRALFGEGTI